MANFSKAIIFYNNKAGHIKLYDPLQMISEHFSQSNLQFKIVEVPLPECELARHISESIHQGFDLFVAAGGDGTVSFVSNHLINSDKTLAILPLGTGNLIAKELNIPQRLPEAMTLITTAKHNIIIMDTIKFNNHHYVANISVGVSSKIMNQTNTEDKRRLGFFAYLFSFVKQLLGLELERFNLYYDGCETTVLASEILISNSRSVGLEALKWSEGVAIDDGVLNIFVIRAANMTDLISLIVSIFLKKEKYNPVVKILQFSDYCRVETKETAMVQADGDCVGETPLEVQVEPRSLKILTG